MVAQFFVRRLDEQKDKIDELKELDRFGPEFKVWNGETLRLLEAVWKKDSSQYNDFLEIGYSLRIVTSRTSDSKFQEEYVKGLETAKQMLDSFIRELREQPVSPSRYDTTEDIEWIEDLLLKFDAVARQLRRRQRGKTPIIIEDEYDVQDLLHALLKIRFNDIRPEEWTPSYAGSSSRIDFLLKGTGIVIETKKTRENLREREIGEHLIVDIAKYQSHPECEQLICFVYDPDFLLSNPYSLEADLSKQHEGVYVKVYVLPKT